MERGGYPSGVRESVGNWFELMIHVRAAPSLHLVERLLLHIAVTEPRTKCLRESAPIERQLDGVDPIARSFPRSSPRFCSLCAIRAW
jgi:hypothetical protein